MIKHKVALISIFIFFVALFLQAGLHSYWLDELYSVYMRGILYETFAQHFNNMREVNAVYPLYEITLYPWMQIFGHNETSTRTLSILFVCGAAFFLYLFTLRLFSKQLAIITLLFFLFSNLAIRFALDARYYGQMLLLSSISSYILLRYSECLCKSFSWKNTFYNKYFLILTLINTALLLNHVFNYLFFIAQALFVTFLMLAQKEHEPWYLKITKVLLIYIVPLLLVAMLWPPIIKFVLNSEIINIAQAQLVSSLYSILQHFSFTKFIILPLAIVLITLVFRFFVRKFITIPTNVKLHNTFPNTHNRILFLIILLLTPLTGFFIINFNTFGIKTAESLPSAFIVFSDYLVSTIFTRPHVAYIILLLLLIYVVIQQIRTITQSGINYNNILLTRRLFLLYPITVILLSFTLIVVIFSFEHEYTFYTRYILFCLPLIMILTSFAIKKGLLLFDYILSNIYKRSIKRFYLKHSLLFSLLFAIVLFAPNSYKRITRTDNNSWKEISIQIKNIINTDTTHKYIIVETAIENFPTLDYYLKRYSKDLLVDFVVQGTENKKMATEKGFLPEAFSNSNMQQIEKNDYLIITFTHQSSDSYANVLRFLSSKYKPKTKFLDIRNRGFIIFDIQNN